MVTLQFHISVDCRSEMADMVELPEYIYRINEVVRTYLIQFVDGIQFNRYDNVTVTLSQKKADALKLDFKTYEHMQYITIFKSIGIPGYYPTLFLV